MKIQASTAREAPETAIKKGHLVEIDVLRSIAIILIVFYHLPSVLLGYPVYTDYPHYYSFSLYFAWFGIAIFFFISGFVIDLHYKDIHTRADASRFYIKRAKRLYPLYWLALSLQFILPVVLINLLNFLNLNSQITSSAFAVPSFDAFTILVNFLGLQVILGSISNVEAIWFIGVILIYYSLYPVITARSSDRILKVIIISLALLLLFVVYGTMIVHMDSRFFYYYLIFLGGIVSSRVGVFARKRLKRDTLIYLVIFISSVLLRITLMQFAPLSWITFTQPINAVLDILFFDSAMLSLILLAFSVTRHYASALSVNARKLFSFIAFSSYCVFLLHQFFLGIVRVALKNILHLGFSETMILGTLFGVPLVFLLCYYIQCKVDTFMNNSAPGIKAYFQAGRRSH